MNESSNGVAWIANACGIVFTATQTNQILEIISIIATCISILVSIAYNIYKWYKDAKADNHIDSNEIKELVDITKEGADDLHNAVNKKKEEKENER